MKRLCTLFLFLLSLGLWQTAPAGEMVTEVIRIGYRPVTEVLPVVQDLVPRPGSVSGFYDKLVIRTTPANLAEIKAVLAELDRAPRNLLIRVRHDLAGYYRRERQEAFGTLRSGDVAVSAGDTDTERGLVLSHRDGEDEAGVRILSTRSRSSGQDAQQVRVLEGREAFIRSGQSVPLAQRQVIVGGGVATVHDSIQYRDVSSGFYVVPRLGPNNQVFLSISPRRARLSERGGGAIDVQSAHTSVSGRLGEWIEIGGVDEREDSSGYGTVHATQARSESDHSIYLRVELIRD